MRAITVMYDSLNRNCLPCYGDAAIIAPNFARLARKTAVFDNFHAGSLPCMPARREMHTGRYNFLHRSWGPLEPFDDSMPRILADNGVLSHCVTDHAHYWQDGGYGYLSAFATSEMIRGQEGDFWHGRAEEYEKRINIRRQDSVNREHMPREEDHPHVRTFNAGMAFLEANVKADNWYLQLEYFDPHEPFFVPEKYKEMYGAGGFDWPKYEPAAGESPEYEDARRNYRALVTMCDHYLGKVLDFMDAHDMWKDTLLIVNTDHGFLLGEHGFFGKNYMPCHDELVRTPFFCRDPRCGAAGVRRNGLAQTIDIAPTLLEYFGLEIPEHMLGRSIAPIVSDDAPGHAHALFGYFGKHVNITDGRHVYMRAGRTAERGSLCNYTLMPQHLFYPFSLEELRGADRTLAENFAFTKGVPVLRIPADGALTPRGTVYMFGEHMRYGDLLFDCERDPGQTNPLSDPQLEAEMLDAMRDLLARNEAPDELYRRIGLTPADL